MKKHGKRLLAAALCLAVLLGSSRILRAGSHAADLVDINDESVFLKQSANTCTLYSVLMMFRRGALLNGDPSWDCFTEDNCRSAWWIEGVGIKNSLSGGGMRAVKAVPGAV